MHRKLGYRLPAGGKACCRPFAFGNPFKIGEDGNRAQVLELFETWARLCLTEPTDSLDDRQLKFRAAFRALKTDKTICLGCWCKESDACHVDIILKLYQEIYAS